MGKLLLGLVMLLAAGCATRHELAEVRRQLDAVNYALAVERAERKAELVAERAEREKAVRDIVRALEGLIETAGPARPARFDRVECKERLDAMIRSVQRCFADPTLRKWLGWPMRLRLTTLQEQRRLLSRGDVELMREGITFLLERSDELESALNETVLDSDVTLPVAEIAALRGLIRSTRAYARCLRSKI